MVEIIIVLQPRAALCVVIASMIRVFPVASLDTAERCRCGERQYRAHVCGTLADC